MKHFMEGYEAFVENIFQGGMKHFPKTKHSETFYKKTERLIFLFEKDRGTPFAQCFQNR